MRRLSLLGTLAVASAALVAAAPASASGPAASGKDSIQLTCEALGDITVSVPGGENSNGVGQIVGTKGHGIPVAFTFTLVDVTTGKTIDSETELQGGGHAHSNQATSSCTLEEFSGIASDVFGDELPPGVAPTDEISAQGSVEVIIKL